MKTPVERLEILTKQFPPDATLVGHLWYTAAPSLHVQATVPPPMDRFLLLLDTPVFGPGIFLCHLSGLWIKAISIFGLGIADFGLREGGAAEAAPIFYGDFAQAS